MPLLDLTVDELLGTTRSVRRRLDLERPVETEVLEECVALAMQAPYIPTMKIHFMVVTDSSQRAALASLYRKGWDLGATLREQAMAASDVGKENTIKMLEDAQYLVDHLHEVPVHVIPCIEGRVENLPMIVQIATWGSIFPAAWNFMLTARSRGLGTILTANHLPFEREAAEVLRIPYEQVVQIGLIPVAYTLGTRFHAAPRPPLASVLHWNRW